MFMYVHFHEPACHNIKA